MGQSTSALARAKPPGMEREARTLVEASASAAGGPVKRQRYRKELDAALDSLLHGVPLVAIGELGQALTEHFDHMPPGPVALSKILSARGWHRLPGSGPATYAFPSPAQRGQRLEAR